MVTAVSLVSWNIQIFRSDLIWMLCAIMMCCDVIVAQAWVRGIVGLLVVTRLYSVYMETKNRCGSCTDVCQSLRCYC